MQRLATLIYISGIIAALILVSGCSTTESVLTGLDYACVDVQVDGPWTDSGVQGRGIKIPNGESLTADTVEALCE
jgi:hypothetical protein